MLTKEQAEEIAEQIRDELSQAAQNTLDDYNQTDADAIADALIESIRVNGLDCCRTRRRPLPPAQRERSVQRSAPC